MARPREGALETAMAVLIQNQAAFVHTMEALATRTRNHEETIAQIQREFEEIKRILLRHEQILADLPEAIRQKVAFALKGSRLISSP